jgi:hypothetical protein
MAAGLLLAAVYYAFLLTNGTFRLWVSTPPGGTSGQRTLSLVYNSMLLHLLHGRFDVDPDAIRWEAMVRDGRTYTYYGILPALARLPLMPFLDLRRTDVSALTCLWALLLAAAGKLAALRAVCRAMPEGRLRRSTAAAFAAALFAGGAQIQFLRLSIYQEALLWAGAFASGFVALAVIGLAGGFSNRGLRGMAALAGLGILSRASTGFGMAAALAALVASLHSRERGAARRGRLVQPLAILALFLAVAGVVNYGRFGHPLRFHQLGLLAITHPGSFPQLERYGAFHPLRIPFGLMYYFTPVWVLHGSDGRLLFDAFRSRALDLVELPPGSFFLSDPLLLLLAALGLGLLLARTERFGGGAISARIGQGGSGGGAAAARPIALDRTGAWCLAAGLAVPPVLMTAAIAMTFRYRMEFYPLLEFLAFLGLARAPALDGASGRRRALLLVLAGWSVVAAHVWLLLYKLSPYGGLDPARGIVRLYQSLLGNGLRKL